MTSLFDFKKIHRFVGRIVDQSNIRHLNWSKRFRDRVKKDIILALGEDCPPLLIQCFKQYDAAVEKEDQPELINNDAYANWIIKVEIADKSELDKLMDAKAYAAFCEN